MKIRLVISLDLSPAVVKKLTKTARSAGHDYDGTKAPRELVRRLLTERVQELVARANRDEDGDE
jgi:hypothetical protein